MFDELTSILMRSIFANLSISFSGKMTKIFKVIKYNPNV
jgi:hypothetical protein